MIKKITSNASIILESLNKQEDKEKKLELKKKINTLDKSTSIVNKISSKDEKLKKKQKRVQDIKEFFMESAIEVVFDKLMEDNKADARDYNIGHNSIRRFVQEEGYYKLMHRFHSQNLILSEMSRVIDQYVSKVISESDETNDNEFDYAYTLDKEVATEFVDKIKDLIPERCIKLIRTRVADSVQSFIDQNVENKLAIKDIYIKANEKAKKIESESLKEDVVKLAKIQANKIYDNTTNVLGAMVQIMSENVYKNETMKAIYMENDTVNTKQLLNDAIVMYTVLEEFNTMEMVDVNSDYITKQLNNMKS